MKSTPRKALLDTNLLLLWLVAQTDSSILLEFKRVQVFASPDIDLRREVVRGYSELVTTPHILAETSNFVDQAPSWRRPALTEALRSYIHEVVEIFYPADSLVDREEFNLLGITDTGLAQLSSEVVVITMDYPLSGKIEALGGHAVNFNHYRSTYLLSR